GSGLGEGVHVAVGVQVGGSVPAAPAPTLDVGNVVVRGATVGEGASAAPGASVVATGRAGGVASPSCKLSTRSNTPMVISVTAIIATRKKPSSAPRRRGAR